MDDVMYRARMKKLGISLMLHGVIIPIGFIIAARLIWGANTYAFLGLIAFFAWVFIFGGATTKKVFDLKKEKDGYQNPLTKGKTKLSSLRLKLVIHCAVIPSIILICSIKLLDPDETVFLGLLGALAWLYVWGVLITKKIHKLP